MTNDIEFNSHSIRLSPSQAAFRNQTLYPIILKVPAEVGDFKPRRRVAFLSQHARRALRLSARKSGVRLGELAQDQNGAPLPVDGVFWSITHKTKYVGAVVSPQPVGIDLERIRSCSDGLWRKTAAEQEWSLAGAGSEKYRLTTFFRFWTSKEAVLKASGTGIKDLLRCCVRHIADDRHLTIRYAHKDWLVEHFFFNGHIASIVKNTFRIDWTMPD